MISLLTLLLAFTGTVLLTHYYIQQLANNGPVALPNHRTMHVGAVPVGGGLPLIVTAVIIALVLWPIGGEYALLLPTLAGLAAVSWFDDVSGVTPLVRFAVHTAAAIACLLLLPDDATVFQGVLPVWLDRVITGIAIVWFINLFNFMDGIDGIAGAETITVALGYALVTMWLAEATPLYGLALALVGASLGFLFWNWSPARIFMGDVGSVPIGFTLAVLLVDLAVRQSLAAALILPLYFAADATLTLARRLKHGEKPWEAHRWHWYQRAARELGSHSQVVWRISIVNAGLIVLALLSLTAPWLAFTCAVALVGGLLYHLENAAGDMPITEV